MAAHADGGRYRARPPPGRRTAVRRGGAGRVAASALGREWGGIGAREPRPAAAPRAVVEHRRRDLPQGRNEAPPAGFEPALPPPEGGALSPELRGPAGRDRAAELSEGLRTAFPARRARVAA